MFYCQGDETVTGPNPGRFKARLDKALSILV